MLVDTRMLGEPLGQVDELETAIKGIVWALNHVAQELYVCRGCRK